MYTGHSDFFHGCGCGGCSSPSHASPRPTGAGSRCNRAYQLRAPFQRAILGRRIVSALACRNEPRVGQPHLLCIPTLPQLCLCAVRARRKDSAFQRIQHGRVSSPPRLWNLRIFLAQHHGQSAGGLCRRNTLHADALPSGGRFLSPGGPARVLGFCLDALSALLQRKSDAAGASLPSRLSTGLCVPHPKSPHHGVDILLSSLGCRSNAIGARSKGKVCSPHRWRNVLRHRPILLLSRPCAVPCPLFPGLQVVPVVLCSR